MPALATEPWRAAARVTVDNLGSKRNFAVGVGIADATPTGDQATWEAAPGGSLTLTYRTSTSGATPPGAPNTVTIEMRLPGGAQVGTVDWTNPAADATRTLHLDNEPLNEVADAIRAGTLEIWMRVQRTDIGTYDVDTRGSGAGGSDEWARGYVRARPTLSAFKMNRSALGDAEYTGTYPSPSSTFSRADLDAVWYRSAALTYQHKDGAALIRTAGGASTAAQRDYTFNAAATGTGGNGRINKDYPNGPIDIKLQLPSDSFGGDVEYAWAATGHASGFTRTDDSNLDDADRYTVDPRITFTQLLQVNDNVFGTPPSSKNVASGQRLSSDLGFIAARAVNALSEGFANSALAWTEKLWDNGELTGTEASPVKTRSSVSATKGGELGWSDAFLTWDNALPGGGWTQKEVITTADLTGLEVTNTRTLTLLSADPRIRPTAAGGDTDNPKDHWSPGKKLVVFIAASTIVGSQAEALVADSVKFGLIRANPATGKKEYLDPTDLGGGPQGTWKELSGTSLGNLFTATVSPADSTLYSYTFLATETTEAQGWTFGDLVIDAYVTINSVPYHASGKVDALGASNPHAFNSFDPTGLFK